MNAGMLKFTQEEMDAKSITSLADRPVMSAAEMKERLDSGDIRRRFNGLADQLQYLLIFEHLDAEAVAEATALHGEEGKFFALLLESGEVFWGNASELAMKGALMEG